VLYYISLTAYSEGILDTLRAGFSLAEDFMMKSEEFLRPEPLLFSRISGVF
jgi:hypothetical protein